MFTDSLSLSKLKVVVIGGSSGIGFSTALLAARLGANVCIASRNSERLAAAVTEIKRLSKHRVTARQVNIEDRSRVKDFLDEVGSIDHLLIPGSTVIPQLLPDMTEEVARAAFDSKFWGPFWCAIDARGNMPHGGSITLYSGVAAERPVKGFVIGAAIDGAVNALVRSLALEYGPHKIRVNAISPGLILTPLLTTIDHFVSRADPSDELAARSPLRRAGEPVHCALAAIGLMLNEYITGEVINVEGGARSMP